MSPVTANPDGRTELFDALSELARRYPHWRVGQLVANVAGRRRAVGRRRRAIARSRPYAPGTQTSRNVINPLRTRGDDGRMTNVSVDTSAFLERTVCHPPQIFARVDQAMGIDLESTMMPGPGSRPVRLVEAEPFEQLF